MKKKRTLWLWAVLLISAIFIVSAITLLFSLQDFFISDETGPEDKTSGDNKDRGVSEPVNCLDYQNKEDCELDPYGFRGCGWDDNESLCGEIEDKETEVLVLDVSAINIKLTNAGCDELNNTETNETYKECDIDIEGTLRNTGTKDIEAEFSVQFLDITSGNVIIEILSFEETLIVGDERTLSTRYSNINPGEYVIRFRVDGGSNLDEIDEDNNIKSDFIEVG